MTTMTLSTAAPARPGSRTARRSASRPVAAPRPAVHGCVGDASTGADRVVAPAPRRPLLLPPASAGVAPLHTPPARLTRRGRVAALVGLVAVLAGGVAVGQATVATPSAPASYVVMTVEPGQTLWGIAQQVAPGVDPRATVERLVAVNGLVSANDITAGDQLSVPLAP